MKNYRTLALRELFAQKMTSLLILTAIILSTMMTAAVGQSAGVLAAMRERQAIAIGGDRYATFVQLTEEQARFLEQDPRLSYAGRFVPLGDMELNDQLSLDLAEYWGDGLKTRPTYTRLVEGRLPETPMELVLPEDALRFLGFSGKVGDKISLSCSKALRHGIEVDAYDYTAEFTLVGITESNFLGYTGGHILGLAGEGTAAALLPDNYLYYSVDIRTTDKKGFQTVVDDLCAQMNIHELDTLYNIPLLNALGIRYDTDSADSELTRMDDTGFSWLLVVGVLVVALILLAAAPAARFAAKVSPVAAMSGTGVKVKRGRGRAKKIRSFERHYAWLNLRRSRGRTVITILSLVMSITVFIALQGFLSLLSVAGTLSEHLGDYSIVNQVTGITPEELAALEADERVTSVAAEQFTLYNTVYTNIHTRIAEIGTQRAVGMSAGSLYRTFLWEGAYYGIIAAVIGCIAGYGCTVLVEAAAADELRLVFPPLLPMAEAVVLSIAACLLATAVPLRKIAKLSIVDSIETVE